MANAWSWAQDHYGVYMALYDYKAPTTIELSFCKGDQLQVLNKSIQFWWFARALTGVSANCNGYIPANYVAPLGSLQAQPWYFFDLKRSGAERLLLTVGKHGAFLVRESESKPGQLVLSVLHYGKVKHCRIRQERGQYFISSNQIFSTLEEMVVFYHTCTIEQGLRLVQPCQKVVVPQPNGLSYNTVTQWEIPRSSIQLLHRIGSGSFGEVYKGLWENKILLAVKIAKPGSMNRDEFLREAQIMKTLHHPNLIQLYGVCTTEEPIYIITELMPRGSLLECLRKDGGQTLGGAEQMEMAGQVAAGMAYLEKQNYIHRDLAARNVLVGENNTCKVADFGLSRMFMNVYEDSDQDEGVYEIRRGTVFPVRWTAPEVFKENKFTIKSDVWSFGVLLYEIMTYGQIPYHTLTNNQVINKICTGERMQRPKNCSRQVYNLMTDCWKANPQKRPTFKTLQSTLTKICVSFHQ